MAVLTTIKRVKTDTVEVLVKSGISPDEARIETELLIEHVFGLKPKDILLHPDTKISEIKLQEFNSLVKKRIEERIPVQYLTKTAHFMGEVFYVDENVLIPRAETEILVEEVLKKAHSSSKIIDIGTGSGCIAIMLAKNLPEADITACDISEKALKVAVFNAKKTGTAVDIRFVHSDLFQNIEQDEKFDIIVSNPPYIPAQEKQTLQPEVREHEPHLALFTDDEQGLSFYEKLAHEAVSRLNTGGILAVEAGFSQAKLVKDIFMANNFAHTEIIKDLSGVERVVVGKK